MLRFGRLFCADYIYLAPDARQFNFAAFVHVEALREAVFARLAADSPDLPQGTRLFDPQHLLHWLKLVGVFEIGTRRSA